MVYSPDNLNFSAYSTIFNKVDDSVFIRNKISNKVRWINNDQNEMNLKINNEQRLKEVLFKEIFERYNNRIQKYNLELPYLNKNDIENVEIVKFSLVQDKNKESSGYYNVFPRTFFCNKCSDFRVFRNNSEWKEFNPTKCRRLGCDGTYQQLPFLAFCEQCGKVDDIFIRCSNENHDTKYLKLIRRYVDSPSTWKVICTECDKIGVKSEFDFLPHPCSHINNFTHEKICNKPAKQFRPINVSQGSVSQSVVVTLVDVPEDEKIFKNWDLFRLGFYLNIFDSFDGENMDIDSDNMGFYLQTYEQFKDTPNKNIYLQKITEYIENCYEKIHDLENTMVNSHLNEFTDYLILKNNLKDKNNTINFNKYLLENNPLLLNDFEKLKVSLGLTDITYISDIHLISSSIGSNKGLNKFYEPGFIPHFEPHKKRKDDEIIKIYSYPYETEGLMIDLDKIKVVNWLIKNKFLNKSYVDTEKEAIEILFNLDENSKAYTELRKLIHTFSHILIRRSSLYTGLNSESCSELLFPKAAAFLIYSTSNINIGGFLFVFENSIFDWFRDVKLDINDCVFDPTCLDENGACFSCLYLQEFVCSDFNKLLDRDVFIGKTDRYIEGFWQIE